MIETNESLAEWLPLLDTAPWLAMDTEADSMRSYPEKLCLLQFSLPGSDELVDPMAEGIDLDPLWKALKGHTIMFHAAENDLRLLRNHSGFLPDKVFDTQVAARLLGAERFGLGDVAQVELGITMDKSQQRADWKRRPLTDRMADYALGDTRYLKDIADRLTARLEETGRLAWCEEWCDRLLEDARHPVPPDPDTLWRLKGNNRLTPRAMAVARSVWYWRDEEAIRADRPPFFILNHDKLLAIAESAAEDGNWKKHLSPKFSSSRARRLSRAVLDAMVLPEGELPKPVRGTRVRITERDKKHIAQFLAYRDKKAEELGLDPSLIVSRATAVQLVLQPESTLPGLMSWQRALVEPGL